MVEFVVYLAFAITFLYFQKKEWLCLNLMPVLLHF